MSKLQTTFFLKITNPQDGHTQQSESWYLDKYPVSTNTFFTNISNWQMNLEKFKQQLEQQSEQLKWHSCVYWGEAHIHTVYTSSAVWLSR